MAIGASAGGLEALTAFVSSLPTDLNVPFVVLQHLSPNYRSMMVQLLARATDLEVREIEDNSVPLPNHIYICLLYTSPSPRDGLLSRMPSSA